MKNVVKGRSIYNKEANKVVEEAILCKIFKCSPDQLEELDWDKVELYTVVYSEVIKKDPLAMLM